MLSVIYNPKTRDFNRMYRTLHRKAFAAQQKPVAARGGRRMLPRARANLPVGFRKRFIEEEVV
jgi:hypothetical protein